MQELRTHIDQAMSLFAKDDALLNRVKEARETYTKLTGMLDDTNDEYEGRMQNFNEWFLFDFIPTNAQYPFVNEYIKMHPEIDEHIKTSLKNVHYSLFEYSKKKFSTKIILKDIVRDQKHIMRPEHFNAPLLPDEIFAGRVTTFNDQVYLLSGIRYIPKQVKSVIVKQAKVVRKLGNPSEEKKFVLQIERLKTRWQQYRHMDPAQIFTF